MASYFVLRLDTEGPAIYWSKPQVAEIEQVTELYVYANEILAPNAVIESVDSAGVRRELNFLHDGSRFVGLLNFAGYSPGTVTLSARAADAVGNPSNTALDTIFLYSPAALHIVFSDSVMGLDDDDRPSDLEAEEVLAALLEADSIMELEDSDAPAPVVDEDSPGTIETADEVN